ncbi:hypothetical protein [Chromobacterium aquaticum]|uniref:Uncharacterized protein n=1 Tax=Chromobacterium aquaticum TaxID=467180 RepID=A0ABV8ZRB3_9NEIS|nr:hypothetical protein [Chromobacterium aquaticum]MCD5363481.1 hypothetical protein [Chromobacterium aquaticum]
MSSTITQAAQISLASAALLNGGVAPSPVQQSAQASPELAAQAAQLAADASAIVTLGGASASDPSYNAAGLLNSFTQAGTLQGGLLSVGNAADTAQQSSDQQVVGQLLGGGSSSSAGLSNAWASVLRSNPELAGQAMQSNLDSGIIDTLA